MDDAPSLYTGEITAQDVDAFPFYPYSTIEAGVPSAINE